MNVPARVLVRLPNWLGDALMSRFALAGLRAASPGGEIRAVGPAPLLALLAPDRSFDAGEPWPADARGRGAVIARLAAWRPDAALVLAPSFRAAWLAWRSGARRRVGFAGEARSPLLTDALPRPERGAMHLSREYERLAAVLGAPPDVSPPPLDPGADGRADAERLRATHGIGARWAVLGPGAAYGPAKRWPAERFAAVGRALVARGLDVLVCGAAAEAATCAEVAGAIGARARALAGRTSLAAQAALCAGAAVAVCNDSGLAHLAAATGAPTVAVFGSTSSAWTAPRGARVRIAQRAPFCSPCFQRTCAIGYGCLTAVTAAHVEALLPEAAA